MHFSISIYSKGDGNSRGRKETELVSENSNLRVLDALGFSNDSLPQEDFWNACAAYFEKITNFVPIPRDSSTKEGQNPSFFTLLLLFCYYPRNHFLNNYCISVDYKVEYKFCVGK